jgi:prepilin-type N-terminal cleavage/methylation domain-containing protein
LADPNATINRHAGTTWPSQLGKRAFTLIELLVVIAIIATLAGLLLSALSRAEAVARATECRNNLRTMGLAMKMYVDEFNHYPPTVGVK